MWPKHWPDPTEADWADLFADIPLYGELYGVHVTSTPDANVDDRGIPDTVQVAFDVTAGTDTETYAAIGIPFEPLTPAEASVYLDPDPDPDPDRERYRDLALATVREYEPGVVLLGVEINRFWELSPEGWDDFVDVYVELYDEIKAIAPDTLVGSNFQWDYMRGEAALTGQTHDEHLFLIDDFGDRLDLVTLTVYPYFTFNSPAEIPDD